MDDLSASLHRTVRTLLEVEFSGAYNDLNNLNLLHNLTIKTYMCPASPWAALVPSYTNNGSFNGGNPVMRMNVGYTGVSGSNLSTDPTSADQVGGVVSGGGILFPNSAVRMADITDGTSNTLLIAEQSDTLHNSTGTPLYSQSSPYGPIPYTSQCQWGWNMGCDGTGTPPNWPVGPNDSRTWNITTVLYSINQWGLQAGAGLNGCDGNSNYPFISPHPGGANMVFCDGSVQFLTNSTSLLTLKQLASRADGSVVVRP